MNNHFSNLERAEVLTQALPYIKRYNGKVVVIKYGGNAMINDELKNSVIEDIILLKFIGLNPIVVHGGGPEKGRDGVPGTASGLFRRERNHGVRAGGSSAVGGRAGDLVHPAPGAGSALDLRAAELYRDLHLYHADQRQRAADPEPPVQRQLGQRDHKGL